MLKGVLQGIVMEIISGETLYGYEIARRIARLGLADIAEGTVYAVLLRLEKTRLVHIERRPSAIGPPRKFYSLNERGILALEDFWDRWRFLEECMERLKMGRGKQDEHQRGDEKED